MKHLRKVFTLLFLISFSLFTYAQEELHIHHINIEDGDATMIGIYNTATRAYTAKVLIDGGDKPSGTYLLPYLDKTVMGGSGMAPHFNDIILTHYHHDHMAGLFALKDGYITADSLIDPSGYNIHGVFSNQVNLQQIPEPVPPHLLYNMEAWTGPIKMAADHGYIKAHSNVFLSYGTSTKSAIGRKLVIGTVNGVPLVLLCVAGWGNTESTSGIVPHNIRSPYNPNDYTLAFVLVCGQFRYFLGGDLGGSDGGEYIDQETPLEGYLARIFPIAHSNTGTVAAGHICGFKADHHGSDNSNEQPFMNSMQPAITMTSAGSKASWHLPSVGYIQRLSAVKPLSVYGSVQDNTYSRGVYFTNLQDFAQGASLSIATQSFNQPTISFDYGNASPGEKASYMIRVNSSGLSGASTFQVFRVDLRQPQLYTLLANFKCHLQ